MSTTISLTEEQEKAADEIMQWVSSGGQWYALGGYAGTGKTTLVKFLIERLGKDTKVLAPTGKAADVLRKKGSNADTVHSFIYNFQGLTLNEQTGKDVPIFEQKHDIEMDSGVVIVDEGSMVNQTMFDDMLRHDGVQFLFVGDHGQLPPVGGDPGLMRNPGSRLETIHRQAAGNPILKLAHAVRVGDHPAKYAALNGDQLRIVSNASTVRIVSYAMENNVDQVIAAFNQTRHSINRCFREALGFADRLLYPGDKLVCLKNNRNNGVFNGQLFTVQSVGDVVEFNDGDIKGTEVEIVNDLGHKRKLTVANDGFYDKVVGGTRLPSNLDQFDYGYVLTCHKSQGSEWGNVMVIDETCRNWEMSRWRYTAYTRAKERLTVVIR